MKNLVIQVEQYDKSQEPMRSSI